MYYKLDLFFICKIFYKDYSRESVLIELKGCLLLTSSLTLQPLWKFAGSFMWSLGLGFPLASAISTESTEGSCVSTLELQDTKLLTFSSIFSLLF